MNIDKICKGTQEFIFSSLDSLAQNNFKTSLINPFVKTAIENNYHFFSFGDSTIITDRI